MNAALGAIGTGLLGLLAVACAGAGPSAGPSPRSTPSTSPPPRRAPEDPNTRVVPHGRESKGSPTTPNPRVRARARARPRTRPRSVTGVRMIQWVTKAATYAARIGVRVTVGCPAAGTQSNVWGTGVYTDDSSICTAATHAGIITMARGGIVTLETRAGRGGYPGTTQNGVTTGSWGQWKGSFIFVGSARPLPLRPQHRRRLGSPLYIPWNKTARHLRAQVGKRFTFHCSPSGRLFTVWGSSIYTDDSSICSAAVHAGYITILRGGAVTLEIQSGQSAYQASQRNGVKSASWRSWTGSFIFTVPPVTPRSP